MIKGLGLLGMRKEAAGKARIFSDAIREYLPQGLSGKKIAQLAEKEYSSRLLDALYARKNKSLLRHKNMLDKNILKEVDVLNSITKYPRFVGRTGGAHNYIDNVTIPSLDRYDILNKQLADRRKVLEAAKGSLSRLTDKKWGKAIAGDHNVLYDILPQISGK